MFNRGLWLSMRAIIRYPQREIEKLIIRATLLLSWYIGNGCCLLFDRYTRSAGLEAAENNHINITIKSLGASAALCENNTPYNAEIRSELIARRQ